MKRDGPGGTSTPSIVPVVKGRPPTSHTYNMVSPISGSNAAAESHRENDSFFIENDQIELNRLSEDGSCHSESSEDSSHSDISEDSSHSKTLGKDKDKSKEKHISRSVPKEIKFKASHATLESANWRNNNMQIERKKQGRQPTIIYNRFLNIQQVICVLFLSMFGVFAYKTFNTSETEPTPISTMSIDEIKEIFPQDNAFWISIETGVTEITNFNKPSVIVLLHKHDVHNFTELLDNITTYASCILNEDCYVKPIVIEGNDLNTHEMIEDYGVVIDRYSPLLNEKHIMVIKNMDDISGSVAQAFHYICDEFSPLVRKSLIIFTIQVDKYKGKALKQAVDILNAKWSDIEPEKLEALITRVSSIVLHVK